LRLDAISRIERAVDVPVEHIAAQPADASTP
jgi:hypothetical protein